MLLVTSQHETGPSSSSTPPPLTHPPIQTQVIFPLDFEKTEQSERFMKTVEAIIKERPDRPDFIPSSGVNIPGPGDRVVPGVGVLATGVQRVWGRA